MDKAIATIIGIVLVLGLIGYAILGQVAGAKDMGDMAAMEQHKVNHMLQNPNIVTGGTVKNYQKAFGGTVVVENSTGITTIVDSALYEMTKTYNANGELHLINFKQVSFSGIR